MFCETCGSAMHWRCTNTQTSIAKYKCPHCGQIQTGLDDYKPPVIEVHIPRHYHVKGDKFVVRRVVNGEHRYIGSYGNEYTAQRVVEKMETYNWDKNMIPQVHKELHIERVNRTWVCT